MLGEALTAIVTPFKPDGTILEIEEPILEDLVKLILGRDSAFLHRAPLAGIRRPSSGTP